MNALQPITTEEIEQPTNIKPLAMPAKLLPFFKGSMPLPPSVDNAYKRVTIRTQNGKIVNRLGATPALEQFKADAALMLTQAHADWRLINAIRESKVKVPLAVQLQVYFSTEWKRDLDGVFKFAIDAAFLRMQLNDNLIIHIEAEKLVDVVEPRVEIEVRCVVR
jgi:Holliday junction resolvase RusA-like endonuclease